MFIKLKSTWSRIKTNIFTATEGGSIVLSIALAIVLIAITISLSALFFALSNWTMLIASIVLAALARVIYAGLTGR